VRLHDLLDGLDVLAVRGDPDVDVGSVVHDSREVGPGALFACIRGATTDGHAHAAAAVDAGAIALLVEEPLDLPVAQARVASVRSVLGVVASRFHGDPSASMRLLGVTGTNGKTTVTYLLEAIARANGERAGRIGTLGTAIDGATEPPVHTTPEATGLQASLARMRDAGVTTVAMEVSSHALEQHRVDGTRFAAVCFTNLTHDHLDYHGTMDAYFGAKARLFDGCFARRGVVSLDDPRGPALRERARANGMDVATFSLEQTAAEFFARDLEFQPSGSRFVLVSRLDDESRHVECSLVGPFNVLNAVAAAATARVAELPLDAVVEGLRTRVVVPGRLERVDAGQDFTVLVDYAHTPDALERVLSAARTLTGPDGRVTVVYGCGGDRDRAKRPHMGAAAARLADAAFLTSDNPRSEDPATIAADVLAGVPAGHEPTVELDRRRAIQDAVGRARPGDVVVIAGKGHEPGQTAGGVTVPFDDRVVARDALELRRCG
jgi:UDP-N-acetylmuramoyl-L-alanyl-D-glutamate--2,6-diaminopimelate ligase